ncbi:MAG: hypothetical protein PHE78_07195 [Candidatus Gastranaerophilales bacterium]|nr:hypothetical protein [Candidatus Gastranaerophilales bacterium]
MTTINTNSYCDQLGLYTPQYLQKQQGGAAPGMFPFNRSNKPMDMSYMMNMMLMMYLMQNFDKMIGPDGANGTGSVDSAKKSTSESIIEAEEAKEVEKKEVEETEKAEKVKKTEEKKIEKKEQEQAIKAVEDSHKKAEADFNKTQKQQGFIGKTWNWMKNNIGASSEKVKKEEIEGKGGIGHWFRKQWSKVVDTDNGSKAIQAKMDTTKAKIQEAKKDPKKIEELYTKTNNDIDKYEDVFIKGKKGKTLDENEQAIFDQIKEQVGDNLDVNRDHLRSSIQKAINKNSGLSVEKQIIEKSKDTSNGGLVLNTNAKAEEFKTSQEAGVDTISSIANGLIIAAAVAASPFTFGASLAIAIPAGAALKVGLKYADSQTAEQPRAYDSLGSDLISGSIDGLAAGLFPGGSSAITNSVAKGLGLQATKTVTKQVAAESAETAIKEVGKDLVVQNAKGGVRKGIANWATKFYRKPAYELAEGTVGKTVNTFTKEGLQKTTTTVGHVLEQEGKVVAKDAAGKTLATISKEVTADGKTIVKTVTNNVTRGEARKVGLRNSTRYLQKNGLTESIEYTVKSPTSARGFIMNQIDKTGAGRKFIAQTAGNMGMGGNIGALYGASSSLQRGEDIEEVLGSTARGYAMGAAFAGLTFSGSKAVGRTFGKAVDGKVPGNNPIDGPVNPTPSSNLPARITNTADDLLPVRVADEPIIIKKGAPKKTNANDWKKDAKYVDFEEVTPLALPEGNINNLPATTPKPTLPTMDEVIAREFGSEGLPGGMKPITPEAPKALPEGRPIETATKAATKSTPKGIKQRWGKFKANLDLSYQRFKMELDFMLGRNNTRMPNEIAQGKTIQYEAPTPRPQGETADFIKAYDDMVEAAGKEATRRTQEATRKQQEAYARNYYGKNQQVQFTQYQNNINRR